MWLRDSLSEQIPGARVMVYGYNANVLLDVSTGRIRTFAQTFLEGLRHQRDSESAEAQERPLILLAHSMGGLIVKQALLIANARADKRFDSILNSAGAVMFLGTPHQGGNGVDMGTFVANFVRAFGVKARSDIIRSLDPRSMVLFDLTDDFRQLVDAKGIEISTLFEIKKTHIGPLKSIWIVEEQSAVLGVTRERKVAINADHAHLCKFKSSTDRSLVTAVQVMKEFCKDVVPIITTRSASTQPPPPDELKYTCLADPDKLDDTPEYPVLILGQITYWALSHLDNRYGMTILAYNSNGSIVGRWSKTGARYVHHIEYHKGMREVAFIGQGNLSVIFKLAELKVSGHTSRFG
ncbi:hypothetical protein BV22DRAFT_1192463 [Leucogyrophana mollusca]|uniref:Uncharacterized protein n=1 Tax=Leucogyrophana mollusca TaxID=85980 RepID=A0ACB8BT47_9AGAM|nr:hypothetical protein BV22DRAFT_1192463 [Leucogyrophana mollusca]